MQKKARARGCCVGYLRCMDQMCLRLQVCVVWSMFQLWCQHQSSTLIRYGSAAANIIYDISGGGVAGAPTNFSRRRRGLFLISGGGVHIIKWWVCWFDRSIDRSIGRSVGQSKFNRQVELLNVLVSINFYESVTQLPWMAWVINRPSGWWSSKRPVE